MPVEDAVLPERSYGCTFGCGNPYDVVLVQILDGTTEFLCIPCLIGLAVTMTTAMTDAGNPDVQKAMSVFQNPEQPPMNGPKPKRGRKNAPATTDDPDVIEAFSGVITADELPEEFR